MKYMLLIYGDEQALDEIEREECYRESVQLAHHLDSAGQYPAAAPLHPTSTAASVRVREGKRLVTDGPFAETREQLVVEPGRLVFTSAAHEGKTKVGDREGDGKVGPAGGTGSRRTGKGLSQANQGEGTWPKEGV